jgi:predicted CopG family antitoxin
MYRGKTFFDILEEVIENKRRQQIETLSGFKGLQEQRDRSSNTNEPMNE